MWWPCGSPVHSHLVLKVALSPTVSAVAAAVFSRPLSHRSTSSPQTLLELLANMPKEPPKTRDMKEIRVRRRFQVPKQASSNVHFQVIGSNTPGGASSLYLSTDHRRYLFNCGEGTQRMIMELCPHKTLSQLTDVFFTTNSWRNMGGFPGMCLTIRKNGNPDVRLHGPPGATKLFDATRKFICLYDFDVLSHTQENGIFTDETLSVEHVPLDYGADPVELPVPKYSTWYPYSTQSQDANGCPINPDPSHAVQSSVFKTPQATAFLLNVKGKAGKLLVDRCMEQKVPPGPLLGELKAGRDVTLEDGTLITSASVMGSPDPNVSALVIEVPSEAFLGTIEDENSSLNKKLREAQNLGFIFHFTPSHISDSPVYQTWMERWHSPGVKQVLLNDHNRLYGGKDLMTFVKKLKLIAPPLFPTLSNQKKSLSDITVEKKPGLYHGESGLKFHIRPTTEVESTSLPIIDEKEVEAEVLSLKAVSEQIAARVEVLKPDTTKPEYPKLSFLGTGSSMPGKYRGVSGILIETCPDKFVILDCGEGTVVQLHRMYGRKRALEILSNLKAVYISHLHADHHLGLISIIQNRESAFDVMDKPIEKLYILGPGALTHFLRFYHEEFEPILTHAEQIKNEHLLLVTLTAKMTPTQSIYPKVLQEVLEATGLKDLATSRAVHCPSSFCVTFTTEADDYKVVYTGDTRPNNSLTQLAVRLKSPNLFIHEATMEHYLLADAKAKKHSTFTEAVQNGQRTNSDFTLLTHFSQRYYKYPALAEIRPHPKVTFALDFMHVNPQTLDFLRHAYDSIELIFADAAEDMKSKEEDFRIRQADMYDSLQDSPTDGSPKYEGKKSPPSSPKNGPESKKARLSDCS
ncbi:hypothetical protein TCAL_00784 [Tigriopus californicus]|uniref:ribonuclease Z n=1 Tax=Tigriopus californicus TaxID=6832 RepID=A0A553NF05_TIGCA|nr:ribonuclease Z, mitochondrial-like [Tigriopus californicus]TRY64011.1 hypothetical protein TCAL_00784 [Tigriopus californicus]